MDKEALLALWDYASWVNERILSAVAALSPEELRQPLASGYDTLFATLVPLVQAAHTWATGACSTRVKDSS